MDANLAGFNDEFQYLNNMAIDGLAPRINIQQSRQQPFDREGYSERPTATYAGSESAGVQASPVQFIPIPEDIQKMAERYIKEEREQLISTPTQIPTKIPVAESNTPHQSTGTITNTPNLNIPETFDFDLFQYAILKDMSCNLQNILVQIENSKSIFEKQKKLIDDAIKLSRIGKK